MNSRERVLTAFAHREPDRVPRWCGASPEFWAKAKRELQIDDDDSLRVRFGDDFRRVFAAYAGPNPPLSPGATYRTVFGVERRGHGYGQPTGHALAGASLKDVHDYPWPDPAWMDVTRIRGEALAWNGQYAILGGDWSPFWHDAIDLLGMENLYYKMNDEPELIDAVFGHIVDYYAEVSRRIFDAAANVIDIFFIGNDFGSQTGPLLGPKQFDRFVLPHLRRLIDLGHAFRLKVQLHCCGGCEPLIPAMIAAGLDGLHAVQPCCHGMDLFLSEGRIRVEAALQRRHRLASRADRRHAGVGSPEDARGSVDHGPRRRLRGRGQSRHHFGRNARGKCFGDVRCDCRMVQR